MKNVKFLKFLAIALLFGSASFGQDPYIDDTDGDTKVQTEESGDEDKIRFDTYGTERMIIDNLGKVGIGTSSPLYKLHISNGTQITNGNYGAGTYSTSTMAVDGFTGS